MVGAAVKEIAKYNLKPMETYRIAAGQILELTRALHNKRLFGSGGDWELPGLRKEEPIYSAPIGLGMILHDEPHPVAMLSDQSDSVGRAHLRSCADPIIAAGLARTYGASATAQYFERKLAAESPLE